MTRNRKIGVSVGVLALLLGIGVNMQVSAFSPKAAKNTVIRKGETTAREQKINAQVNLEDDKTSIKVKDMEIWLGDDYSIEDLFVSSTFSNGADRPFHDITLTVYSDLYDGDKPGVHPVTFEVYNCEHEIVRAIAYLTIKDDKSSVKVKNSTINVGDKWKAEDNYVSSVDYSGKETSFKDVRVAGTVDTSKPGTNIVYYRVYNHSKHDVTSEAIIHVKGDEDGKDNGGKDNGGKDNGDKDNGGKDNGDKDNGGKDNGGKDNGDKDNGGKDNGDKDNGGKDNGDKDNGDKDKHDDKTRLEVKDSIIYIGDKWQSSDNLVKAINKDGKSLEVKDITVEGSVDTTKSGEYEVVYTMFDKKCKKVSKKAIITVKAKDSNDNGDKDNGDKDNGDKDNGDKDNGGKDNGDKDNGGKDNGDKDNGGKDNGDKDNTGDNDKGDKDNTGDNNKGGKDNRSAIGGGAGSDDGGPKLPHTGYDVSIITALIGLAGFLGAGSLYLRHRQNQE